MKDKIADSSQTQKNNLFLDLKYARLLLQVELVNIAT